MTSNSIMVDLNDPRTAKIADVISNKTAKNILRALSEKEMSESDIATEIEAPANTVNYNIKKLVEAGLVEKSKKYLWSAKGKKMDFYRVANRRIVISPKTMARGVVPALIVSLLIALVIAFAQVQKTEIQINDKVNIYEKNNALKSAESASGSGASASFTKDGLNKSATLDVEKEKDLYDKLADAPNYWAWYLIGALTALFVVLFWSVWKK